MNSCASSSAIKKINCCSFCKNHDERNHKTRHKCPFQNCNCILCGLTRKVQKVMRNQQRVWRRQKKLLINPVQDPEPFDFNSDDQLGSQMCGKCRNHNHLRQKKKHHCPYIYCMCDLCSLTFERRQALKHQQRMLRSKITTKLVIKYTEKLFEIQDSQKVVEQNHVKLEELVHRKKSSEDREIVKFSNQGVSIIEEMSSVPQEEIKLEHSSTNYKLRSSPPPLIDMFQSHSYVIENDDYNLSEQFKYHIFDDFSSQTRENNRYHLQQQQPAMINAKNNESMFSAEKVELPVNYHNDYNYYNNNLHHLINSNSYQSQLDPPDYHFKN